MSDPVDDYYAEMHKMFDDLAEELGVSKTCAMDVWYLRTRSRWTQELEGRLIALYAAGTSPNICEFG